MYLHTVWTNPFPQKRSVSTGWPYCVGLGIIIKLVVQSAPCNAASTVPVYQTKTWYCYVKEDLKVNFSWYL